MGTCVIRSEVTGRVHQVKIIVQKKKESKEGNKSFVNNS